LTSPSAAALIIESYWTELPMRNKSGEVVAATKLDTSDFHLASAHTWSLTACGYARARKNGKAILLHRLIMGASAGQVVDHINHDTLDNRRENLRVASKSQNAANRRFHSRSHGFIGVVLRKEVGLYVGRVTVRYRMKSTALFKQAETAARHRDVLAVAFQGEFACLNFPIEEYFPW